MLNESKLVWESVDTVSVIYSAKYEKISLGKLKYLDFIRLVELYAFRKRYNSYIKNFIKILGD